MKTVMELSNRKVVIPYAIGALALVVAFLLRVDEARYPALVAGLTPVRVALKASTNPDRASFTPIWSEPHYVAVVFPLRGAAPDTDAIVDRAQHAVGPNQDAMPAFDFGWRVLKNRPAYLVDQTADSFLGNFLPTLATFIQLRLS